MKKLAKVYNIIVIQSFIHQGKGSDLLKDCLRYLFLGFRNKYFNKISLENLLYFQKILYKF